MNRVTLVIACYLMVATVNADQISIPHPPQANTKAKAAEMKANLDTLVEESNEHDERIEALETPYSRSPVWTDSAGKVLGGYDGSADFLFIRIDQTTEVFRYNFSLGSNNTGSCLSNRKMWYTEENCQGEVVMATEESNGVQWANPGIDGQIHVVGNQRTDLTELLQSYSQVNSGCSASCVNQTNGPNGHYEAVPTGIPNNLGATPPFQLSWPD